jgi:electron transport complex protein RnfD
MDEALIREQEQQLQKTGKYYKHICWMAVPPLCMACYLYGLRPLLLCGIAMLTGNLCDRLVSLLRHRVYQNSDLSNESFALVIALLMPVTVDIYVLVAAVLAGVLIGKEVFGGYGSYPFNPAAVGYAVAAVSWPTRRPLATLCHRRQTDWRRSKKRSSTSRGSCRGWKPVWPGWKAEPTIWFQKALRRLF